VSCPAVFAGPTGEIGRGNWGEGRVRPGCLWAGLLKGPSGLFFKNYLFSRVLAFSRQFRLNDGRPRPPLFAPPAGAVFIFVISDNYRKWQFWASFNGKKISRWQYLSSFHEYINWLKSQKFSFSLTCRMSLHTRLLTAEKGGRYHPS
jgi:hypothetical protein